jgi:transcriptional regulator with XRE-family HTH domain
VKITRTTRRMWQIRHSTHQEDGVATFVGGSDRRGHQEPHVKSQMSPVCSYVENDSRRRSPRAIMVSATNTVSRTAVHEGDRQLRRTCARFGEEFREIRLRAGVSQSAVARAVGVARSVICRIEQGDPTVSPRTRARAAAALGATFRLAIFPEDAPLIHDAAHAKLVERVLALRHPRWRATLESPVPEPGRRSTDIRLDHGRDIVLTEIESRIRALEGIIRECAEKRAAVASADDPIRRTHVMLVLPPTRHHRELVAAHPRIVAAAFPADSRDLAIALADSETPWPGDGILWLASTRDGTASRPAQKSTGRAKTTSR